MISSEYAGRNRKEIEGLRALVEDMRTAVDDAVTMYEEERENNTTLSACVRDLVRENDRLTQEVQELRRRLENNSEIVSK